MSEARALAFRSGFVRAGLALGVLLLCTAPTPGDIGGCGQRAQPLDGPIFFERKKVTDCEKCGECGFTTQYCDDACSDEPAETEFGEDCEPLVHDGEVCLNALAAAGCGEYEQYVEDEGRQSPEECRFCPAVAP